MKKQKSIQEPVGPTKKAVIVTFVAMMICSFGCSFLAEQRLWGLNAWGYLPLWVRAVLLLVGLGSMPLILRLPERSRDLSGKETGTGRYLFLSLAVTVAFGAVFWVFRGSTHFLGDGYITLSTMASSTHRLKGIEFGEMMLHFRLAQMLGGNSEQLVRLSYQIISVLSGILLTATILWTSGKLFDQTLDRMLFSLVILVAGTALLFFGYVENYSLFTFAIGLYTCVGLLISTGEVSRWWILSPAGLAVFLHLLGLFLIPPTLLILFGGSLEESAWGRLKPAARMAWLFGAGVVGLAGLAIAMRQSMFLQITLLSPISTRFTIEGYTLFSFAHLLDFVNLLVLLLPGLGLAVLVWWNLPMTRLLKSSPYRFLGLLVLSAASADFVLDPKLGMPRDWDLFSIVGIPLAAFFSYAALDGRNQIGQGRAIVGLAVVCGMLTLGARVTTQFVSEMGIRQIQDYMALDPVKGEKGAICLQGYYAGIGEKRLSAQWGERYQKYPDVYLSEQGNGLIAQNRLIEALAALNQAIRSNPMTPTPYPYLSVVNFRLGRRQEARAALDTALALSPGNPQAHVGMGFFLQSEGNIAEAEQWYRESIDLAPDKAVGYYYLGELYMTRGDSAQYVAYLTMAASKVDADAELFQELGDYYLATGHPADAAVSFERGLGHGLRREIVQDRLAKHPELAPYLTGK